jgi:CcmD family protein
MTLAAFGLILSSFAQQAEDVEMADAMRASGKIYVVVTVLAILFTGIVVYLISLDRKISKLEKESASGGGGKK